MLLFGPFTQQAVGTKILPLRTNSGVASIARSASYPFDATNPYIVDGTSTVIGRLTFGLFFRACLTQSVDPHLTIGISAAMGFPQTPSQVGGHCPTADCSWEPYRSLGICYSVEDISATIVETATSAQNKLITVKDLRDTDGPSVSIPDVSLWLYVDPVLANIQNRNKTMQQRVENGRPLNTLVDIYLIYTPPCAMLNTTNSDPNSPEPYYNLSSWRAYRATLSACIQRLNSSVTKGTANTNVLEENIPSNWSQADVDVGPSTNVTAIQTHHANQSFFLTEYGVLALWNGLQHRLRGNGSYIPGGDTYFTSDTLAVLTNDVNGEDSLHCNEDPALGFNGFDRRMKNLAVALSNQ